jgi:hypothetical protein
MNKGKSRKQIDGWGKTMENREKLLEEIFELALQNEMNYHG